MKKFRLTIVMVFLLSVMGCQKPTEHQFIYTFENPDEATVENSKKL